jgi:hypothetical protein
MTPESRRRGPALPESMREALAGEPATPEHHGTPLLAEEAPPAAEGRTEGEVDSSWLDLMMYGMEHVVRGSDTGTLVAFAALAFQQIRGKGEVHHTFACGLLLLSVLMCAVVHFAIGNAYVERAKLLFHRRPETRRHRVVRWASYSVAWVASILQFVGVVAGTGLILLEKPPAFMVKHVLPWFGIK